MNDEKIELIEYLRFGKAYIYIHTRMFKTRDSAA